MRDLIFDIKARDQTGAAFAHAERNARAFNGTINRMGADIRLAAMSARAFAAGFTISSGMAMAHMVREVVGDAARLVDIADKVGVSTKELQTLTFGFGQAGVEVGQVEQGLTEWAKRIGEAHTKGGELRKIFDANGVSLTDQNGKLRSSVDLMGEMAELIRGAASDQERVVIGQMAFGKAGDEMAAALRNGRDSLAEMENEIRNAGGTLDEELLRKAAQLDDKWARMWRDFATRGESAILRVATYADEHLVFGGVEGAFLAQAQAVLAAPTLVAPYIKDAVDFIWPPAGKGGDGDWKKWEGQGNKHWNGGRERRPRPTVIPTSSSGGGGSSREVVSEFEREIALIRDRYRELEIEARVYGMSTGAAEKYRVQMQLETAARADAIGLTAGRVKTIDDEAAAYGRAAEAAEQLREGERRAQAEARFWQATARGAVDDIKAALEDGKVTWQEFGDVALNVLERIGDKLLDSSLDSLFSGKGGGGWLGRLLGFGGSLLGGGGGMPDLWEVAFDSAGQRAISGQAGIKAAANAMAGAGGGSMRIHVTAGVAFDDNGNLKAFVKDVAQSEADGRIRQYDKSLPDKVHGKLQSVQQAPRRVTGTW